jgi:hypothetical protein
MKQSLAFMRRCVLAAVAGGGVFLSLSQTVSQAQTNTKTGVNSLGMNFSGSGDTADGADALFFNTTGACNTATGYAALYSNNGNDNTANGQEALYLNTTGSCNTAGGFEAMRLNTTGTDNTANGCQALYTNTVGSENVASGYLALYSNTNGDENAAIGMSALYGNTSGNGNVANGGASLDANTTGSYNTSCGVNALYGNTTGSYNAASGWGALAVNTTGSCNTNTGYGGPYTPGNPITGNDNVSIGFEALPNNTTGSSNIAIGEFSGATLDSSNSNNIAIGSIPVAVSSENNTIRIGAQGTQTQTLIAGIAGAPRAGSEVVVNANGVLGTAVSSMRFKEKIRDMSDTSLALFSLRPVTFRYKQNIDPKGSQQFGLVAEEVDEVNPALVVHDAQGKPYSVRYDSVNAMLLNEFLKQNNEVSKLGATIASHAKALAQQRKAIRTALARQEQELQGLTASLKEQAALLQKVNAQMEINEPKSQVVSN